VKTLLIFKSRLTNKSNIATSLERQLEMLINDYRQKEENIKEKYNSKEKNLQLRMIELETQLSKLKLDYNALKRDKEDVSLACIKNEIVKKIYY
jgi:molybdenum-dependent DNA-binding transcriptional regulator ModE